MASTWGNNTWGANTWQSEVVAVSLTGLSMGPSLFDIASLLGKDETIKRLEQALKTIK